MSAELKQQNRTVRKEALMALEDIREKYRKLPSTEIEKFAPVYYPIAVVEMNLDEMTFEAFESVQYAVLSVAAQGITDHCVIAQTLGLSPNYIFRVLKLLHGYGHIDEHGITPLGSESIRTGQKIVRSQVWQQFQMDALNGTLLRIEKAVTENMLNDRGQTNVMIGHLNYPDGMSAHDIISQLADNKISEYIAQRGGILNTNVTGINDIRCTEVKYARCYLMKLRNCDVPIVFAKRYDSTKRDIRERFSWQPFSVKDQAVIEKYGFESDIPYNTEAAEQYIGQLYGMLLERGEKTDLTEEIPYAMKKVYPFDDQGVRITGINGVSVPTVYVDVRAFRVYRSWIISFLISIADDGEYLITNEGLYGYVISLMTQDPELSELADLLLSKAGKYGRSAVAKRLRDRLNDYAGEDLIGQIRKEADAI